METRLDIASPIQPNHEVISPVVAAELLGAGAVKNLSDYDDIWHGRAGNGAPWQVDPYFNNHKPQNVYDGVMYATPVYEDAKSFAKEAAYGQNMPVVERFVATNGCMVITGNCDPAIGAKLNISDVTEALPVRNLTDDKAYQAVLAEQSHSRRQLYSDQDIAQFATSTRPIDTESTLWHAAVKRYLSAQNTTVLLNAGRLTKAAAVMVGRETQQINVKDAQGNITTQQTSFSKEYVAEVFRRARIAGVSQTLHSATINRVINGALVIWDKESLQVAGRQQQKLELQSAMFKGLERSLASFSSVPEARLKPQSRSLRAVLQDPYASPDSIMKQAKSTDLAMLLNRSAGVWEGYTTGEHTEAALDLFERYYANKVPAAAVGFLRTALFLHDIGKPIAIDRGQKANQKMFIVKQADILLKNMGYNQREKGLVIGLIGDGAELFSNYSRYGKGANELATFKQTYAKELLGRADASSLQAVSSFLEIMYTCDAGAYTEKAQFRRGNRVVRALQSLDGVFDFAPGGTNRIRRKAPHSQYL